MKRLATAFVLSICFSLSPAICLCSVKTKEIWLRVQTKNFTLIGNAGEKEIRKIGLRLEQFREVVSVLLDRPVHRSFAPMTVIVFKDDISYKPFKPTYLGKPSDVTGYFQSSDDTAHITLKADWHSSNPYQVIFHEYIHSLTSGEKWQLPTWINEGIAEYYSTFIVSGGNKEVVIGHPIAHHVQLLRRSSLLPLETVIAVNRDSKLYNESEKKTLFYAQSWALVHYLLLGNQSGRRNQFLQFIDSLMTGKNYSDAFRDAFKTDYASLEKELNDYIGRNLYRSQIVKLDRRLTHEPILQATILTDAEVQSYLGDLLWRIQRPKEAEVFLQRALALNPDLIIAHHSIGLLRVRQNRYTEAKNHLQKAIAAGSQNYLSHYYYAYALQREQMDSTNYVSDFASDSVKEMRAALEKTSELAPDFPDTYKQLAFINLVLNLNLDEAVVLLKHALTLAPQRDDIAFTLAQVYLRQQNSTAAREIALKIVSSSEDSQSRSRAQSMLETMAKVEERLSQVNSEKTPQANRSQPASENTNPKTGPGYRFEGEQARGLLMRLDCSDQGVILILNSDSRQYRFYTPKKDQLFFVTYTRTVSHSITCGAIDPPKPVIITYRTNEGTKPEFDGLPIGVEFIKPE
jgi:tetratricopeptide (TPR) repeat protein